LPFAVCRLPQSELVPGSSAEFSEKQNLFMPKMREAQIARPGGTFEMAEREVPQPAAGWVRIKVQACGIYHSDSRRSAQ